jgi:SnoaL-like domain
MDFFDGTDPISIKLAVDALVARYVDYCDTHDWAALVDLFEADGVFDTGDVYGLVMTGPEELRAFYETAVVPLAHHATSVYLTEIGDGWVRARMKMITIFPSSLFSVDYDWTVTRVSGPWRIARQRISLVGKVSLRPTAPTKTATGNAHAG